MIRTQDIKLPAEFGAQPGLIVFSDDVLLAVLGYLDGAYYETDQGKWHVEAAFSPNARQGDVIDDIAQWLDRIEQHAAAATPPEKED